MYMEQTRPDHAREIFIRIIRRLTLLLCVPFHPFLSSAISNQCYRGRAPESDAFFAFCYQNCQPQSCPLDPDASVHFIHRFLTTSESNETLRRWLIEADIARLLDLIETRSRSCGTWTGYDGIRDSVYPQYITRGPTYHALVLSLAWRIFQSPSGDESADNFASEDDLWFPVFHHDDWADNQMDSAVFRSMRQIHRDHVYSWIET